MNAPLVREVLTNLARLGVREVCVAAGARNAPLVAALMASEGVKIWNFFEERCAGFFALGRMMVDRVPVAVITTSGTAAAELFPAVIEAHYQGMPLVVVTADRPPHYRFSGAPQAIDQLNLFGGYAMDTLDLHGGAERNRLWPLQLGLSPLHVNVCLDEGITDDLAGIDFAAAQDCGSEFGLLLPDLPFHRAESHEALREFLQEDVVVVAGALHPVHAGQLWSFLEKLGAPIVAEATANLQGHPCLVPASEQQLQRLNPRRVLRLGAVPSWRWWRDLETQTDVPVMNLTPALYPGLARRENVAVPPFCAGLVGSFDLPDPPRRQAAAAPAFQFAPVARHPLSEPAWMGHLAQRFPAASRVFLGNSLPIREFNLASAQVRSGAGIQFYASRGANGIDGLVSTFLGISASAPGASESWLILGDLSALYDLAAPWIIQQLPPGNRRIVVINNGGGKIFSRVASLRALPDTARNVIENQHQLQFEPWAQLWGLEYRRLTDPAELADLPDGPVILEVCPDAAQTEAFWQANASA